MPRIKWADWKPLGPLTAQPAITPKVLVFHTMAGYLRGTDAMFRRNGLVGVESTFGVGGPWDGSLDGALWQWQDTHRMADAQSAGNRYANSVETSDGGSSTNPWSSRQLQTLVRLVVDWCKLTGNPCRLVRSPGDRGLGYHALFSAWNPDDHACPGVVRKGQLRTIVIPKARALLEGAPVPRAAPVSANGQLAADGILGPETIAAVQRRLETDADGVFGPATRIALQHHLGTRQDAVVGPVTVAALRERLELAPAGQWDDETTRALQRAVNADAF